MQLYVVTWTFNSSEDQIFADNSLVEYYENEKDKNIIDGYERIAWLHTPQDGTGIIICKALNASILYKVFNPWREKHSMNWEFKPALTTEELVDLIKSKD